MWTVSYVCVFPVAVYFINALGAVVENLKELLVSNLFSRPLTVSTE